MSPHDDDDALKHTGCKLDYHTKVAGTEIPDIHPGEADRPSWYCRDTGWALKFDDPAHPWWSWRSIERFWVRGASTCCRSHLSASALRCRYPVHSEA